MIHDRHRFPVALQLSLAHGNTHGSAQDRNAAASASDPVKRHHEPTKLQPGNCARSTFIESVETSVPVRVSCWRFLNPRR